MTAPRELAKPIFWSMTFLESGTSVGDVLFETNGAQDWVTLGGRTFGPGEPIDNFEFAGKTCYRQPAFSPLRTCGVGTGGRKTLVHVRPEANGRLAMVRNAPYLRITDKITKREYFFLCVPLGMFESQWAELTPVAHCPRWLAVFGQIEMIGYLLQDAMVIAVLYWLPLYFAGPKLMPVVRELLGNFLFD